MLLETAIGDAYGVGFEFASLDFVLEHNHLTQYYPHQRYKSLYKRYSDDTQMSLAIAELIIEGVEWENEIIANKFLQVFRRDKREGYSSRIFKILNTANNGKEFILQIDADSDSNGAAMRAGSIGFYKDSQEVLEKAAIQAKLTHNSNNGIKAAQAAALMTHYFLYEREPKVKLGKYIDSKVIGNWEEDWTKPVAANGIESVRAAITALKRNNSMKGLLKDCINFTGDVDTVAAIALGAGSVCLEIDQDLPQWMYEELENGTYGKRYLMAIDKKLEEVLN